MKIKGANGPMGEREANNKWKLKERQMKIKWANGREESKCGLGLSLGQVTE